MTNPHDKAIEVAAEALLAAGWEAVGETPEDAAMIARSIMGGISDDSDDDARIARLAARAAIAAYERAMWRPIEEAPKDGTPILGHLPCDGFSPETGIEVIWFEPSIGCWLTYSEYDVVMPTHFRPLLLVPEGE